MTSWTRLAQWFGFGAIEPHRHHGHGKHHSHGHGHGVIDPSIAANERGIFAVKWSFVLLAVTAGLQLAVVAISGSIALFADTIHNVGDAMTAIPLWIAFSLARRPPSKTFNYGLGRVEDLAGLFIVLIILVSALVAGYEAVHRLIDPKPVSSVGWVVLAGFVGFVGNEAVAMFRIRIGREIESTALVADGYHARTDGLTSLAVVFGAIGVWLGFPLADPIVGILIALAIYGIVWQAARAVLTRTLDGVEPGLADEMRHAAEHVGGIEVVDARARWLGHQLHADVSIAVDPDLAVSEASRLAEQLRAELMAHLAALRTVTISFAAPAGGRADLTPLRAPSAHG